MFASCDRRGVIEFGTGKCHAGMLEIARARSAKRLKATISAIARHAYDGTTLLVPGVPEAENDDAACDAVIAFRGRATKRLAAAT